MLLDEILSATPTRTRTLSDMTDEEVAELEAQYGCKVNRRPLPLEDAAERLRRKQVKQIRRSLIREKVFMRNRAG